MTVLQNKIIREIMKEYGMKEVTRATLFHVCNFHFFSNVDLFLVIQIAVFFGRH